MQGTNTWASINLFFLKTQKWQLSLTVRCQARWTSVCLSVRDGFDSFLLFENIHSLSLVVVVQLLSLVWVFVAPRPSLSPGVCSDSCPVNQWCYLTISSSAAPFSFCLQSLPASESFPMSYLFTSGDPSTEASTTASDLSMALGIDVLEAGSELVM